MSYTTRTIRDRWQGQDVQVSTTHGSKYVSISLHYPDTWGAGVGGSMTPDEARSLAEALIAHANEVDA